MERVQFLFLWLAVLCVAIPAVRAESRWDLGVGRDNFSVFEENGKVGLKDEDGHVLIPAAYEAIGWSNGKLSIVDQAVGYQSNGMWGLIHTSNKVLTPPEFLNLRPAEGSYLVAQKRSPLSQRPSFGVINTSGKVIIPFLYDGLELSNMRALVMSRSGNTFRFGLTDLTHKIVIPVEYQRIHSLGSLRYAVSNFENKTAIFADDGTQVTGFEIDSIAAFRNDFARIYKHGKQGLIDRSGHIIVQPEYASVRLLDDGTIQARDENTWVFLSGDNQQSDEWQADRIQAVSDERYILENNAGLRLTNNEFAPLHEEFFSAIDPFQDGRAVFRRGSKSGVISNNGKVLIPPVYDRVELGEIFVRASIEVSATPRWVMVDYGGQQVSEKRYEYIGAYNGRFHPVKNRGFWGALDVKGREIITCVHDSLLQTYEDYIVVKFKGQYGVINLRQNWIVTPKRDLIKIISKDRYLEFDAQTTFLKDFRGGIVYFSDNDLTYEETHLREHLPAGGHWLISLDGVIIQRSSEPEGIQQTFSESEGFRPIMKDGKYGFIDEEGRLRIANRYEAVRPFMEGRAGIRIMNRWGFIDKQEQLVVQPVYDSVGDFHNGLAIVTQDGLVGIIDSNGKVVVPLRYDHIQVNKHNRFVLHQGDLLGIADESGRTIVYPKYDHVSDPGNGYLIVGRSGKYGALTLKGVSTIPMIYDDLVFDAHHNQFLALKRAPWKTIEKISGASR